MAALNANADGVMAASVKAYSAPATAQKMALATKATSFQLAVRTPSVSAAISLVAIARRARPEAHAEGALGEDQDEQGDDPHQVVLAEVGVDLEPEEVERRHRREAHRAAGDPACLDDDGAEDDAEADGGQRQIEVTQAQHGATDDERDDAGQRRPGEQGQQRRHVVLDGQDRCRVGADAVEGRVAEGELAGLGDDEIDADHDHQRKAGERHPAQRVQVLVEERPHGQHRDDGKLGDRRGRQEPPARRGRCLHDRLLGLVAHPPASTEPLPRIPDGRKYRMMMSRT